MKNLKIILIIKIFILRKFDIIIINNNVKIRYLICIVKPTYFNEET